MTADTATAVVSPTSLAQARIHFLDQLAPSSTAYNIGRVFDLVGALDITALTAAVRAYALRNDVLRACFRRVAGELRQVVTSTGPELIVVDVRDVFAGMATEPAQALVDGLVALEAREPFRLTHPPLVRFRLIRTAEDRSVLTISIHHIVADARSLDVLVREISGYYTALVNGTNPQVPAPHLQYADYAAWQRRAIASGQMDAHLAFWRDRIGSIGPQRVPTDRPRPARPSYDTGIHRFPLDSELVERLRRTYRPDRATMFMILLAGFAIVLHRYSGQNDIVLGSTTSGRDRSELNDMIGFFVDMLVLPLIIDGDASVRDTVRRTVETCMDVYEHKTLPFEQVVALRGGEREADRHPVFQVVFQMLTEGEPEMSLAGVSARTRPVSESASIFDLTCTVTNEADTVEASLAYATDLFESRTIVALAASWRAVLLRMADDPDAPVRELALADTRIHRRDNLSAEVLDRMNVTQESVAGHDAAFVIVDRYSQPVAAGLIGELCWRAQPSDRELIRSGLLVREQADGRIVAAPLDVTAPPASQTIAPQPASSALEEHLSDAWAAVLKVPKVGRDDNFFVLGGHSLLATILVGRLQEALGRQITLDQFFRNPTPAMLAREIETGIAASSGGLEAVAE